MREHEGFADVYHHHLARLLHTPRFHNAPRGFPSQEELGVGFRVLDPLRRVPTQLVRRTNIVFNFAEALWYLAGRDDLEFLAYYAPRVAHYSADGRRLTGTAYGPRIFRHGRQEIDQWASVANTLRDDPDSKRAVIQIYRPDELSEPDNPDVACTLAIQFLVRENRLHAITFMRANDAYRGMVSDVFSFTFLQEFMARELGVALGHYTHMVGSLHLYEPDLPAARRVLQFPEGLPEDRMPAMPPGRQHENLARVLELEERLRGDTMRLDEMTLDRLDLHDYWAQVLILFELYRRIRHGDSGPSGLTDRLSPLYRALVLARFPSLNTSSDHPVRLR